MSQKNDYRLPSDIKPLKYHLTIEPTGPDYYVFDGQCRIDYYNKTGTTNFDFNSKDLTLLEIYLESSEVKLQPISTSYNLETERVTVTFEKIPEFGSLNIKYKGLIYEEPVGFYRFKENNQWVLLTQFEAINARRCYPCFDEPGIKSLFQVTIIADIDKKVLSNTEILETTTIGNKMQHRFHTTPPMSTYLLSFYLGHVEPEIGITESGKRVSIYYDQSLLRPYILKQTIKGINLMEKLFNYPYQLSKLDIVYVNILESAAMENWGLITIRKMDVVLDSDNRISPLDQISLSYVIYHELAHQWFGNLVTMKWWSDIWLHESLATWLATYIISILDPDWKSHEIFYLTEMILSLSLDSLTASHPIVNKINNPKIMVDLFNSITYSKGSVVIDMLVEYIGLESVLNGIRYYLRQFEYNIVTTNDFLDSLQRYSQKDLHTFVKSWILQKNFPLIKVETLGNHALVQQSVYQIVPKNNADANVIWTVPLNHEIVLQTKQRIIPMIKPCTKFNKNGVNFYVVAYDAPIMNQIINYFDGLTVLDVADILTSSYFTLLADEIKVDQYFEYVGKIVGKLSVENPSGLILRILCHFYQRFSLVVYNSKLIKEYNNILENYISSVLDKIGLNFSTTESVDIIRSRIAAFELACLLSKPKYVIYCQELVQQLLAGIESQELVGYTGETIMETAIKMDYRNGLFYPMYDLLLNSRYQYLLPSLTMTPNYDAYRKILELVATNQISFDLKLRIIQVASHNTLFNKYLWYFIKNHWDHLVADVGAMQFAIIRMIYPLGEIVDENDSIRTDMIKFFVKNFSPEIQYSTKKIIEQIGINTIFNRKMNF